MTTAGDEADRTRREAWARAARAWERWRAEVAEVTAPVSQWMVSAVEPAPGRRLLELAAGPGDTGFMAAARLSPGGTLLCSDQAAEMVDVARRRAAELRLDCVEFAVLDAQRLDLDDASFDGVLCRFGYMLMGDAGAAMRETRRVLREKGRLALAVWDTPDRNLWMSAPVIQLVARGALPVPEPDAPTPFSLADQGALRGLLEQAGFGQIVVERLEFEQAYASLDQYWEITLDLAAPISAAIAALDGETTAAVREGVREVLGGFIAGDGSMSVPATAVVASAVAA